MPLPASIEGKPLIPAHRIVSHGPRRLRPMQGQTLDNKTGLWRVKNPKKSPDPQDRKKLLARVAAEADQPIPREQKKFDLRTYRCPPGRVLLRVGKVITNRDGIVIPSAANWTDQEFTVVAVGWLRTGSLASVPFRKGDRVFLDAKTHQRPLTLPGHPPMVLVKIGRVGAVVSR